MRATAVLVATTTVVALAVPMTGRAAAAPPSALGARVVFDRMSQAQRIGQLFMVGTPAVGVTDATRRAISTYHVGNVILTGRSSRGVAATRALTDGLQGRASAWATGGVPLLISTDQEGGQVQVLSGPGFSSIPSGVTQGTWSTPTLQSSARAWGDQLAAAGVGVDLAPVMDTVPVGRDNPPIGGYDREYGHDPATVAAHGTAFAIGMGRAGVLATIKHFPGLGRVTENTDTHSGVTDHETTSTDPYLAPFRTAIGANAPMVMMSTAYYSRIDPSSPAAFSSTIVTGLLRGTLAFQGVVISDDLGNAAQVAAWTPGGRAVHFLAAGGDIVLTVNADQIPEMTAAVASEAAANTHFAAKVDAAVMRVLLLKQAHGLIRRPAIGDFTADGRSDAAVYRPSDQTWRVAGAAAVPYGMPGDLPAPANFTGSGRAHIAVFRPSTGVWYVRQFFSVRYGQAGDVPVPGDYDSDGVASVAVFRPSTGTWYRRGLPSVKFGQHGDVPVPGDWAGTGATYVAVYRPANGNWYRHGLATIHYGEHGDVPVPGDYTGDGILDPAVYRPASRTWYIRGLPRVQFGQPGDVPLAGFDFDGDGVADIAVWRPSDGVWYIRGQVHRTVGAAGDVPV